MAETLTSLKARVFEITKRPELDALTLQAVKLAVARAHQTDFFHRDARALQLTYPVLGNTFVDVLNFYDQAPLMRTPNFMIGEDALSGAGVEKLEFLPDAENLYGDNLVLKSSVFTFLGDTLRIRFAQPTGRASLYHYVNPDTSNAGFRSWIADAHPDEIAQWAAAIVWARSGNVEQAKASMDMTVIPFKELLVSSYLLEKI